MTQFQDAASLRKLDPPARAFTAPILVTAGIVVVLMAAAVMSYALAGRTSDAAVNATAGAAGISGHTEATIAANLQRLAAQGTAGAATIDGHTEALKAANLWRAQQLNDGSDAARVLPRTNPAVHGWVPAEEADVDASIYRFLLPADQAAVTDSSLRFAPQPAETTGEGGNQRFVNVD